MSAHTYFLLSEGQEHGPFTMEQLIKSLGDTVPHETPCRRDDESVYKPAFEKVFQHAAKQSPVQQATVPPARVPVPSYTDLHEGLTGFGIAAVMAAFLGIIVLGTCIFLAVMSEAVSLSAWGGASGLLSAAFFLKILDLLARILKAVQKNNSTSK